MERIPLTPIQSTRKKSTTTTTASNVKMVGRQSSSTVISSPSKNLGVSSSVSSSSSPMKTTKIPTTSSSPLCKAATVDKEVQTDHPDLALITGDDAPPSYWKDLAETRRVALEEALTENEMLHQKVAELEADNQTMEEMLEHAKKIAEIISAIPDEEDSGIAADQSIRSTDQSQISTADHDEESDED